MAAWKKSSPSAERGICHPFAAFRFGGDVDHARVQADLNHALHNAIRDALDTRTTMSTQALGSERIREGLNDVRLGPAQLYEALRARSADDHLQYGDRVKC